MSTKLMGIVGLVALSGTLALGGCGGGNTDVASTPAVSETTSSSETDDEGCLVAEITGQSKNSALMALAMTQYESLDCSGDLVGQLKALGADPKLKKEVDAAGWNLTNGEAMGAATLSIVDVKDRTTCIVTAMDSPKGKTLNCGDL